MPLAAMLPVLDASILSAYSLGQAATPDLVATNICAGIQATLAAGIIPGTPPIPTTPAGIELCKQTLIASMNLGIAATEELSATLFATAVSLACPIIPPAGLSTLKDLIKASTSLGIAAQPALVAKLQAIAIITYFTMGGAI